MSAKKKTAATAEALPRTALATLKRADPALGRLIAKIGPYPAPTPYPDGHLAALVRSIVYQQLSGKAAATIFGRVRELFAGDRFPSADQIGQKSDAELRACGLSQQKLSYLRDLAARASDGRLDFSRVGELPDEVVIEHLTAVRGIGRWSAEMFLMFHLGRHDVWPVDDLGIRKAVMVLHGLPSMPAPRELHPIGERYRPYRSVASWYLWRLLELTPEDQAAVIAS